MRLALRYRRAEKSGGFSCGRLFLFAGRYVFSMRLPIRQEICADLFLGAAKKNVFCVLFLVNFVCCIFGQ